MGKRQEGLIRDVGERCAHACAGRDLRDQHGGLPNDRIDDELGVHLYPGCTLAS
ncbi:hypothetical protein D3C83_306930 [compost metagenome]